MLVKVSMSDSLFNVQVVVGVPAGGRVGVSSFVGVGVSIAAVQLTVNTSITTRTVYRFILTLHIACGLVFGVKYRPGSLAAMKRSRIAVRWSAFCQRDS